MAINVLNLLDVRRIGKMSNHHAVVSIRMAINVLDLLDGRRIGKLF